MGQNDQGYLLARFEQERELASRSADEIVRAIHLKLAHEYAMRAHGSYLLFRRDDDLLGATSSR